MAACYSLLSSRSSAERTSVRAFVRITWAASSRESPAMSVSHTNASMPSVAPIPKTSRSSSGSGMRPLRARGLPRARRWSVARSELVDAGLWELVELLLLTDRTPQRTEGKEP